MFLVIAAVKKTYKAKESFADNLSHNILKLFDVITFFFTASEMRRDYL